MYGYTLVIALGAVILVLLLVGFARGNAKATGHTQNQHREKPVVGASAPAADEPTADRSSTASPRQVEATKKHTPPS